MNVEERNKLYTVRWCVRERWGDTNARDTALQLLNMLIDPTYHQDHRPSQSLPNQHLLWCPFAERNFPPAAARGTYAHG